MLETVFAVVILPLVFVYLFSAIGVIVLLCFREARDHTGDREKFPEGLGKTPLHPPA